MPAQSFTPKESKANETIDERNENLLMPQQKQKFTIGYIQSSNQQTKLIGKLANGLVWLGPEACFSIPRNKICIDIQNTIQIKQNFEDEYKPKSVYWLLHSGDSFPC